MQCNEIKDNTWEVTKKNLNLNLQITCSNKQYTSKSTLDLQEGFNNTHQNPH